MAKFPTSEWVQALMDKLNNDIRYAQIAHQWEGDMRFVIEPEGVVTDTITIYLDLWHGKCRQAFVETNPADRKPAFTLKAPYGNFSRVIKGDLEPMQALLTRKISVQGNMAVLMRSIPTVVDFVRCCRDVTDSVIT